MVFGVSDGFDCVQKVKPPVTERFMRLCGSGAPSRTRRRGLDPSTESSKKPWDACRRLSCRQWDDFRGTTHLAEYGYVYVDEILGSGNTVDKTVCGSLLFSCSA